MKYIYDGFFNSMLIVLVTLPIITLIISAILSLFIKKRIFILSFIFIVYIILTFTIFNSSFLVWVPIYIIIAYIGTLFGDSIRFFKNK